MILRQMGSPHGTILVMLRLSTLAVKLAITLARRRRKREGPGEGKFCGNGFLQVALTVIFFLFASYLDDLPISHH